MQEMRKEMGLKVDAHVRAYIGPPSHEAAGMLRGETKFLAHEVRAKRLTVPTRKVEVRAPYCRKTGPIDEAMYEGLFSDFLRLGETWECQEVGETIQWRLHTTIILASIFAARSYRAMLTENFATKHRLLQG